MNELPKAKTRFTYTDEDGGGRLSGLYEVVTVGAPDKWGDVAVKVKAVDVVNWPGTSTIYRWSEQVEKELIKII